MDQTVRSRTRKKFKFELRMFRRQLAYRQRWRGQIWEAVLQTKRSNKYSSWYWTSAPCLMRTIHRNMYIENGGDDRPGFGWQVEPEKDIGVQFGLWLGVWSRETDEGDTYNIIEFENQTISEMAIRGRWSPSNWKDLFQVKITKKVPKHETTYIYRESGSSTNDSSIAFFHHIFPYIARPFEKVTAPLVINLLSRSLRTSFIISRSNGTKMDVNIVQSECL